MTAPTRQRWDKISSVFGALAWVTVAAMAGTGHAPFGVIELLLVFAPLVAVPLGLSLAGSVAPVANQSLEDTARVLQPLAAVLLVCSFWFPPGFLAAIFAAGWALVCVLLALAGFFALVGKGKHALAEAVVHVGRLDLGIAAAWLLASRSGFHPLGFQEPIVLLTAVHFHYTGFGTALLAGTLYAMSRRHGRTSSLVRTVAVLVALLPFVLAAGFVFSATLKLGAALALALTVGLLAALQLAALRQLSGSSPRLFLCGSSLAVISGMILAAIYALGDFLGKEWLPIPAMASMHGVLNGLGFVLLGLLAWLMEIDSGTAAMSRPLNRKAVTAEAPTGMVLHSVIKTDLSHDQVPPHQVAWSAPGRIPVALRLSASHRL
jgi:hypothetical protein